MLRIDIVPINGRLASPDDCPTADELSPSTKEPLMPSSSEYHDASSDDERTNIHDKPMVTRRQILQALTACGVGSVAFQRALASRVVASGTVTAQMIEEAQWIAGLDLDEDQRASTAASLQRALQKFDAIRDVEVGYDVPPALYFYAAPHKRQVELTGRTVSAIKSAAPALPEDDQQLAFLSLTELAALVKSRQVTSQQLTELYLKRLEHYDPVLHCVVTLTSETAMEQAKQADKEIADGKYRGPLHGIPWGAKDLIAYPGYKTSWGAPFFRDQVIDEKATVAERIEKAGAVLVAKLSLGALAMGDRWFGGMTRNPWNTEQGSSGSSAGSASATAAGLVGFAIGSETLGSIISPSRRCGNSSLRPTYGRVSRHGCMALSWSMDKLGPICRSIEDCALVFGVIHGADGKDPTAVDQPFDWPAQRELSTMRIGYIENGKALKKREELAVLEDLGVTLVPIELPQHLPAWAMTIILNVEAATVFDEITRKGITDGLNSWPGIFRQGQFVPAVEYLRANRARTVLMQAMSELMETVDCYVGGDDAAITNLTGHPSAVLPAGFKEKGDRKTPYSVTFTGQLFGETDLLSVAHAYQLATGQHLKHPTLPDAEAEAEEEKES
jgi:Asp-tRNA(Asn)/Glu-tRNA(Gln) amidotransferase A subunit family amidase